MPVSPHTSQPSLPEYDNPPVVETRLGVQFDPLPALTTPLLARFCFSLGKEWETTPIEVDEVPQQFERFAEDSPWLPRGWRLELQESPGRRLRLPDVSGVYLLQVQNGRIDLGWRRGTAPYVRHAATRPKLDELIDRFRSFVCARVKEEAKPNQWEVTYVNHLPRGTVWQEPTDWRGVFPSLPMPARSAAPGVELESFGGEWHYRLAPRPDGAVFREGRLHVRIQHQETHAENEVDRLMMTLTSRGSASSWDDAREGVDAGRRTIVQGFTGLTSEAAHRYWERRT